MDFGSAKEGDAHTENGSAATSPAAQVVRRPPSPSVAILAQVDRTGTPLWFSVVLTDFMFETRTNVKASIEAVLKPARMDVEEYQLLTQPTPQPFAACVTKLE